MIFRCLLTYSIQVKNTITHSTTRFEISEPGPAQARTTAVEIAQSLLKVVPEGGLVVDCDVMCVSEIGHAHELFRIFLSAPIEITDPSIPG